MNTLPAHRSELVHKIIELVLDGSQLKDAVKQCGLDVCAFGRLLQKDKAAAMAYARAVELRADILADEALHIADTDEDSSRARNRIQVRQWLASKLHAKRYGDRIDLNVTQTLDISSTLAEARARILRPASDLGDVIDAQVIDSSGKNQLGLSDNQSVTPPPNVEPDIFS
jgi:hypothetical protein